MRGFKNGNRKSIRNIEQPYLEAGRRTPMERLGNREVKRK
jgi:hypothetical protein